jgi:hypothetical protein
MSEYYVSPEFDLAIAADSDQRWWNENSIDLGLAEALPLYSFGYPGDGQAAYDISTNIPVTVPALRRLLLSLERLMPPATVDSVYLYDPGDGSYTGQEDWCEELVTEVEEALASGGSVEGYDIITPQMITESYAEALRWLLKALPTEDDED